MAERGGSGLPIIVAAASAEDAARLARSVSDPCGRLLYAFRLDDLLAWARSGAAEAAVADPRMLPPGSPQAAAVGSCVGAMAWTEGCFVTDALRLLSPWGFRPAAGGVLTHIPRVAVVPRSDG